MKWKIMSEEITKYFTSRYEVLKFTSCKQYLSYKVLQLQVALEQKSTCQELTTIKDFNKLMQLLNAVVSLAEHKSFHLPIQKNKTNTRSWIRHS